MQFELLPSLEAGPNLGVRNLTTENAFNYCATGLVRDRVDSTVTLQTVERKKIALSLSLSLSSDDITRQNMSALEFRGNQVMLSGLSRSANTCKKWAAAKD
jgi:hypothetical protein